MRAPVINQGKWLAWWPQKKKVPGAGDFHAFSLDRSWYKEAFQAGATLLLEEDFDPKKRVRDAVAPQFLRDF